jgi:uncharacterized protein with gpF-like domain
MNKQGYIRRQKIIQNRLMKVYIQPVFNALMSQYEPYIETVKSKGVHAAQAKARTDPGINHQIGPVVNSLYGDAAKLAEPQLRVSKGFGSFGINLGFIRDVLAYFADYLFEKVVLPISQTTMDDIRQLLDQAIAEGWGVDKTVSEMENSDIPKWRSRMIVRTESVRAMNYSQLKAADDKNFEVEKMWIAIEDNRTRIAHTHAGVDGEVRDLYDSFSNNLLFPGDPAGSPEQTINCRCTLGYQYKKDLNGDFIPKEKNPHLLPTV